MKTTKVINLTFTQTSGTANAYVNITFPVKRINTRAIAYQRGGSTVAIAEYGSLLSDLINNDTHGVYYNDSTYGCASTGLLTQYEFRTPTFINGNYNFTMYDASGAVNFAVNTLDYIILVLEFEDDTDVSKI